MIYGKTNCQEIHCAKLLFFFCSLSESFTAVGDEEKFELGKGDENIKLTSNEKQFVWSQRVTEVLSVSLSVSYHSVMCNGAAEREVKKTKPPLHKQIMG